MTIARLLDDQQWIDRVRACVDPDVRARSPIAGVTYAAFIVHSPRPPSSIALAIGHRAADKFVIDLVQRYSTVDDSIPDIDRYRIKSVTGAVSDTIEVDGLAHAVAGVIHSLQSQSVS